MRNGLQTAVYYISGIEELQLEQIGVKSWSDTLVLNLKLEHCNIFDVASVSADFCILEVRRIRIFQIPCQMH